MPRTRNTLKRSLTHHPNIPFHVAFPDKTRRSSDGAHNLSLHFCLQFVQPAFFMCPEPYAKGCHEITL